jgi:hypothetical protein
MLRGFSSQNLDRAHGVEVLDDGLRIERAIGDHVTLPNV